MNLQPSWIIQGGLFVISTPDGDRYINLARSSLNSDVSVSLVKNKFLARQIMQRHDLPNIPFACPQTYAEAEVFLRRHTTIIVKPISGTGAEDIHIVSNMAELQGMDVTKYIFEKYISGVEMRFLVLDGAVIAVHKSDYGISVEANRALERISYSQNDWNPMLVALSLKISLLFGLHLAAVDFLIDPQGRAYVLEVNTTPGLKWFHAPSSGPVVDVATLFLSSLLTSANGQMQASSALLLDSLLT